MPAYEIKISDRAKKLASTMDFHALLDQAMCPRVMTAPTRLFGGIFLGGRIKADELRAQVVAAHALPGIRPIITGDLECGAGVMVPDLSYFQSQMALGAAGDEKLAYAIGLASAQEGRSVGYDWSFSPCVDIASDPDNPITSVRSPGSRPETIIPAARGYLQGMQAGGVLATLKHFPGEGQTSHDQHLTTIHNPMSMDDWRKGPGHIYKELIAAGAATVMPGHIALPSFEPKGYKRDSPMPATISHRLKNELLRQDLGFQGLIVSDAINMGGVSNYGQYYEMCAMFWESGGDMLLFPMVSERFYREMERLREAGILKEATLRDRVERILSMKDKEGILDGRAMPERDSSTAQALSKQLSEKSVTLIRDREKILPLKPEKIKKLLHLILDCQDVDTYNTVLAGAQFREQLEKNYEFVETRTETQQGSKLHEEIFDGKFDAVIVSIFTGPSYANSTIRLRGEKARTMMSGWITLGKPVVFVAHRHPWVYTEFEDAMNCVIASYGSTEDTARVIVDGLRGARAFQGRLP